MIWKCNLLLLEENGGGLSLLVYHFCPGLKGQWRRCRNELQVDMSPWAHDQQVNQPCSCLTELSWPDFGDPLTTRSSHSWTLNHEMKHFDLSSTLGCRPNTFRSDDTSLNHKSSPIWSVIEDTKLPKILLLLPTVSLLMYSCLIQVLPLCFCILKQGKVTQINFGFEDLRCRKAKDTGD